MGVILLWNCSYRIHLFIESAMVGQSRGTKIQLHVLKVLIDALFDGGGSTCGCSFFCAFVSTAVMESRIICMNFTQ